MRAAWVLFFASVFNVRTRAGVQARFDTFLGINNSGLGLTNGTFVAGSSHKEKLEKDLFCSLLTKEFGHNTGPSEAASIVAWSHFCQQHPLTISQFHHFFSLLL